VTSTKTISTSNSTTDWCSCFSSTLKEKSSWSTYLPFGSGCFFWLWWMYVVLASVVVVLICVGVLVYWCMSSRKSKKDASSSRARTATGSRGSSRHAALVPTETPAGYHEAATPMAKRAPSFAARLTRARSTSQGSRSSRPRSNSRKNGQVQLERPKKADPPTPVLQAPHQQQQQQQQQQHPSLLSSPRSPVSDASSIALLSPPIISGESNQYLKRSAAGKQSDMSVRSSSNWRRWGSSYEGEEL
jgi:FtsZ-interacting cell division protein ZipA